MKNALLASNATWKITSSHDPFGIVTGGPGDRDSFGQEDLVYVIFTRNITGVVSLSSDVHFTSHVNMDPSRIQGNFTDFKPLDEFVIGTQDLSDPTLWIRASELVTNMVRVNRGE